GKSLHAFIFTVGDVEGAGGEIELVIWHGLSSADKFSFHDADLLIDGGCDCRWSSFFRLGVWCGRRLGRLGERAYGKACQREQTENSQFHAGSPLLIYELVGCCKRYHGDNSKPAVRAIAAKVSVKCRPALEATTPQTALPRASPPCKTSTYIEITRARTQAGAAVCAAVLSVARMLIHASPAAAENADAMASEGERTSPQSATAKITVAQAMIASGEKCRRA